MPNVLKNGALGGSGGKRKGAGRKPDLFRRRCAEFSNSATWWKFVREVFANEPIDPKMVGRETVLVRASVTDKTHLWEKIAAYGFDRPAMRIADADGGNLSCGVILAPQTKGEAGGVE